MSYRIKYISLIFPTAVAKLNTSCSTFVSDMHLVFLAGLRHRLYLDHHIYVTCLHIVNMCDVYMDFFSRKLRRLHKLREY